jgi:DNA-binding response OmpR family regulator
LAAGLLWSVDMSTNLPPSGALAKVLFLDDDSDLRRLVPLFLKARGFDVTVAEELEEAGALLSCRKFDVLCADLSLDGLSRFEGLGLIEEARVGDRRLLIVVQTGSDDPQVHAACLARGADSVVVKRGSLEPLVSEIRRLQSGEAACAVD